MSIQHKILQSQGLTDYETHIVDSLPTSKYFKVYSLEDTIPGGRSTFQILGSEIIENDIHEDDWPLSTHEGLYYSYPYNY